MGGSDFVKYIDYGILGASAVLSAFTAVGALYVIPWTSASSKHGASKEYNSLWGVRVCMQLTATLWLLSPALQLHEFWWGGVLDSLKASSSLLCRMYLAGRLGGLEPFFLFTSLLTFRQSLRMCEGWRTLRDVESGDGYEEKCSNVRIILMAALHTFPILGLQTMVAYTTVILPQSGDAPDVLVASYEAVYKGCSVKPEDNAQANGTPMEGGNVISEGSLPGSECIVCLYPVLSTIVSGLFILYCLWRFWQVTYEMTCITLNHCIQQRIRTFRTAVTVLLSFGVLCRGLTALTDPRTMSFELLRVGDFLSMVLFVFAATGMLSLRPVHDARVADKSSS